MNNRPAPISYTDPNGVFWQKSTYSGGNNGCIEAALALSVSSVGVRDTKDPERKIQLNFAAGAWQTFVDAAKCGDL